MEIDLDMTELSALKASFMVVWVVVSQGCIMVATGLPDFSASESNFLFFG